MVQRLRAGRRNRGRRLRQHPRDLGRMIAIQNLVNGTNPPSIMSVSYGNCEAENGASVNAAFSATYQQAVAEGISVFVSAGDEGAASCDAGANAASHGIGVSGFAPRLITSRWAALTSAILSPAQNSEYWSATNSATYTSALSYVPEIPWVIRAPVLCSLDFSTTRRRMERPVFAEVPPC